MSTAWDKIVKGSENIVTGGVTSIPKETGGYPGDSGFSYKKGTPMGFSDYLKAYGTDSNKNFEEAMNAASQSYGQSVKAANDDFYRSLMTYGQNAEAMASGGLTGAGVSNYGDHAAYAARQGAVATAGATKQLAAAMATATKRAEDKANADAYSGYLSGYYAGESAKETELKTNRSSTLLGIYNSGETDVSQISLLLTNSGYFSAEEIPALAEQYAAANLGRQKSDLADGIHAQIVNEGIYDEATIRARYSTIPGLTEEEINAYVAKSVEATAPFAKEAKDAELAAIGAGKNEARIAVATYVQENKVYTLEGIEAAFKETGKFTDEEIKVEAKTLYDGLNQNDALVRMAAGYYSDILNQTGSDTMAKKETEAMFGSDVLAKGMAYIYNTHLSDFEKELKSLDKNGFAVAYGVDEEGNTVAVDMMAQLESFYRKGYFEGNEGEYERLKGDIQNHNAEYLSSLYDMARNEHKIGKIIDTYGITLPEDADDEDVMKAAVEAVKEDVMQKYTDGYISYEWARDILLSNFREDFSAIWGTGVFGNNTSEETKITQSLQAVLKAKEDAGKLGTEQYYKDAIDAFSSYWNVTDTGSYIIFTPKENPQCSFSVEKNVLDRKNAKKDRGEDVRRMKFGADGEKHSIRGDLPEIVLDIYNYLVEANLISYSTQIK